MPSETEYVPALRFKWLTRYYDVVIAYSTREKTFKRALINQAGIESGMQVLDLASGTGTLAIWIKQQYPSAIVTGVVNRPAFCRHSAASFNVPLFKLHR